MNNSIIELKEADSQDVNKKNGSYTINLKKHLTLFNNDEVIIKNVFLDTVSSSGGLIVLDEKTTVTMNFCRAFTFNTGIVNNTTGTSANQLKEPDKGYHINLNIPVNQRDQRHIQASFERNTTSPTKKGDGFSYFQLEEKNIGGTNNFIQVVNIEFFSDISGKGYSGHYGGTDVAFAFKGLDGNVQDVSFTLLNSDGDSSGLSTVQGITSFIYDTSWKGDGRGYLNGAIEVISSTSHLEAHNLSPNFDFDQGATPVPAGKYYNLKQESITFDIPSGTYDPNDLARIITDNCIKRPKGQYVPFDSSFSSEFPFKTNLYGQSNNGSSDADDDNLYFICEDFQVFLNLSRGANLPICGCNEFSFIYDPLTTTFKYVSLHSPFYVDISSGGQSNLQIGTQYSIRGNTSNTMKQPFMDSKRGEIIIMGLTAFDENNKPVDFWFDKLGLNPNILAEGHQNYQEFKYNSDGADIVLNIPHMNLTPGINQTDAFLGSDSIMDNSLLVPLTSDYTKTIKYANLMTTPIFGLKTLGQITDTNGYFLISITGYNNNVRVIGERDIEANIGSIVSRYYASTSYTNGYISDSISYIHKGEPLVISDFNINILDPGHQISSDIGNNSTIFLLINRAEPQENK